MPNTPADPNHPTKEPFTSAGESTTGGSKTLFGIVAAPFAAVGGLIDQVSRKVTRAADGEEPTPTATPTTKEYEEFLPDERNGCICSSLKIF
ncbi:hypothetical protein MBANPS3_003070 [Mucor bainieri]